MKKWAKWNKHCVPSTQSPCPPLCFPNPYTSPHFQLSPSSHNLANPHLHNLLPDRHKHPNRRRENCRPDHQIKNQHHRCQRDRHSPHQNFLMKSKVSTFNHPPKRPQHILQRLEWVRVRVLLQVPHWYPEHNRRDQPAPDPPLLLGRRLRARLELGPVADKNKRQGHESDPDEI